MSSRPLILLLLLFPCTAFAQERSPNYGGGEKDLTDVIRSFLPNRNHPKTGSRKGIYFSVLPAATGAAGPSGLSITATTAAFHLGGHSDNFLSTVSFAPYIATQGRMGFALRSNLWLPDNSWDILGDIRLLYYPQDTWGLGGRPDVNARLSVNYKYVRFYQTVLKRIEPYLFAGAGILIDDYYDMDTRGDSAILRTFTHYPFGTGASETSFSRGISLNLLYDTRKNTQNPFPGYYFNLAYRINPLLPGSNTSWTSLYLDTRKYIPFSRRGQNMLALWGYYWTVFDSHAPYLDLPSIGWDPYQQRSGRGFPQNRYRGNSLMYGEAEYRRDLTANGLLGFVLFANVNSVTEPNTDNFVYIHPAVGAGLRLKFNKKSGTNIALDFGHSSHYSGLYLNLGETF